MKRLMYVIPLSAMVVLVFAAIAVAQSVPEDQEPRPNTTDMQNSTTEPVQEQPAETTTPTETTTPAESTVPAPNSTIIVDIHHHDFDPNPLKVDPGTTVEFINTDTVAHTATADNELFDTGVLEPGDSFSVWFDGSGTVTYHCALHPYMKGSIVVGEGGGGEGTAPTESASPARGY